LVEWFILSAVGAGVVIFVDIKWIYPASQGYMWRKNPEWVEFIERFEKMEEKVDEIHRIYNK